jgi:hypothetical protein
MSEVVSNVADEGKPVPDEVKCVIKLPDLEFPGRLYDTSSLVTPLEGLQDDFKTFLLNWFKKNDWGWQRLPDRDIVMVDFALTAIAPLMVEWIAPRVGSIKKAEEVLSNRFLNWGCGRRSMEWANGLDINDMDVPLTELFGNVVMAHKLYHVDPE